MTEPFWFTSSGAGLWVQTTDAMDVKINDRGDGLGQFAILDVNRFAGKVFIERYADGVYADYVGSVGKPAKSEPTYRDYRRPVWNTWAQFYLGTDQRKILDYAERLSGAHLPAHAVQIDGGWEEQRGDLTFDPQRFPDPKAMSRRIHQLGFAVGTWVSFYITANSSNFEEAKRRGFLMRDGEDRSQPCIFPFVRSTAPGMATGMLDLGNREAKAWYTRKLRALMEREGVDGLKIDYPNLPSKCAPASGHSRSDYRELEAAFADQFDLQGLGIRLHWGMQRYGFAVRGADKSTDWKALQAAVTQGLAVSTVGYPFVETDMIGGSAGGVGIEGTRPPNKAVLVRWAQAASLMPLMNSSTVPVGDIINPSNGQSRRYDAETTALYKSAVLRHERLAPFIWARVREAVATGEPIMKPLFFAFPTEARAYKANDEWLLGDAILAAPVLTDAAARDVYLPAGRWFDVTKHTVIRGPTMLKAYPAGLQMTPTFVRLGIRKQTDQAMRGLTSR
ncbi:MAG: glycoside hydrolase family 31 protein [Actinomycetota bacterium]|nr:glycosyl hydrolase family 31 [Acidobacteriota bacterium]MDQ3433952.1 glycoside hydrolase family 31 protein [Actinomycetota bacterium]